MNQKLIKIFSIVLLLVAAFFFFGCKKDENDLSKDEEALLKAIDEFTIVYQEGDSSDSVTKNITFTGSSNLDIAYSWFSSNQGIIAKDGYVIRPDKDTDVIMTVIVSLNDKSFQKSFNLKVIAKEKVDDGGGNSGSGNGQSGEGGGGESEENIIVSASFDGQVRGNTPIIEGWDLHVAKKGAYDTGWTSFRDNGEYVVTATFDEMESVQVKFVYYLNNVSTNGNKSSKIEFQALDKDGNVLTTFLSGELNDEVTRSSTSNPKEIVARLDASGISAVKVIFRKDGGGNIGFSLIEVSK